MSDGSQLEALVALAEKAMLPYGFEVSCNERVFDDDGRQTAEFDIQIKGTVGSTDFSWLIECRDRPSSGPAPVAWIEQLVGRRDRFNFHKVTAVSTTGFAKAAKEYALCRGIELREVARLSVEEFSHWIRLERITSHVRHTTLLGATFLLDEATPKEQVDALGAVLRSTDGKAQLLRSPKTGALSTPSAAFNGLVAENQSLFQGLAANGPERTVRIQAEYPADDRFIIDTALGPMVIPVILFVGELRLRESLLPVAFAGEYRHSGSGKAISQVVAFAPESIGGVKLVTEMHNLADSGETRIVLRRLAGDA